jgi:predicted permease
VRLSLGAGRLRIVRQLLTESLLLSFVGAALGLIITVWTSRLLISLLSPPESRLAIVAHIDGSVIGFTALISILTAGVFGLVPAFRSGRVELTSSLKAVGASTMMKPESRLSKALVTAQVALSVLLLVGAGLFVRTLHNLRHSDLGFEPKNLLLFGLDPTLNGYHEQRLRDLFDQITERLRLVPGVGSVSFVHHTVVSGNLSGGLVAIDVPTSSKPEMNAMFNVVGLDYFKTMGLTLLLGRNFDARDTPTSAHAAVISKQLATQLFGKASPLGHALHTGHGIYKWDYQIVGVVNDAKYGNMKRSPPTYYALYTQVPDRMIEEPHFVVRTVQNPRGIVADVRRAIAQIDPQLPIYKVITESEEIDLSLSHERLFADLTTMFGALALLLACVGLYGIMAYSVSRRTQEIGIRVALGADRRSLSAMVVREAIWVVLLGVAVGLPAAMAVSRLIASFLWDVKPFDPQTLAAAAALMLGVATVASAVPAHRATRIDPMQALRAE